MNFSWWVQGAPGEQALPKIFEATWYCKCKDLLNDLKIPTLGCFYICMDLRGDFWMWHYLFHDLRELGTTDIIEQENTFLWGSVWEQWGAVNGSWRKTEATSAWVSRNPRLVQECPYPRTQLSLYPHDWCVYSTDWEGKTSRNSTMYHFPESLELSPNSG